MALASWPVRKYKAVFFRYSISTKSFRKWPVLKQLKTGTAEDAVGNQGGKLFINWLVFVKKVKLSGLFYHWYFGSSGHMITRSALQSVVVPLSGSIPSPWTLKKCCFSPWTPGGIYHLSLSLFMRGLLCCYPPFFFVLIVWPGQGTVDWTWQICFWWHNFQLCHFRSRTYSIIVIVTTWTLQVGVVL